MDFAIGDHVVHPRLGTGQITGVRSFDLIEGYERYYVIEMKEQRLSVRVPIANAVELGVRPVMSRSKLNRVLDILGSAPDELPENSKARQATVRKKLEMAKAIPLAEAVRDLAWHKEVDHLTKADNDLLNCGRNMLAEEMAIVTGSNTEEADQLIMSELSTFMKENPDLMVA
ncbi:MAG: CarD family transcriptional regulator [Chloroflexota bacterium]|nr:CarD family transcriptional regulator [Chloroflexota bacterium]